MVDVNIVPKSKPFWKSKTFQVAALTVVTGVLTTISGNLEMGIPITVMSVLMMFFRAITDSAVSVK